MTKKWKLLLTSGPLDEEWLELEIWYEDEQFGLISHFGKRITIYPKMDNTFWEFDKDEFISTLNEAIKKLGIDNK